MTTRAPRRGTALGGAMLFLGGLLLGVTVAVLLPLMTPASEPPPPDPPASTGRPDTDRFDVTLGVNAAQLSDAELARALDMAADAGATQIQSGAVWWYLNRDRPPRSYDWRNLDRLLAAAEERGLRVVLQLSGTPDWVHPGLASAVDEFEARVWHPPVADARQLRHWGDFVDDVVERYGDRVALYELWNEPNSVDFWQPAPSPAEYASLLRTGYLRAKAADPGVVVGLGGLSRNDVGFLQTLYAVLVSRYEDAGDHDDFFDVLGVHPYSGSHPPDATGSELVTNSRFGLVDESFTGFRRLRAVLREQGDGHKPLYLGEYGFSTTDTWMEAVPDETRAEYLRRAFAIARRHDYVIGLHWYAFHPDGGAGPWAIVDEQWQPTATFEALAEVARGR